MWMMFGCWSCAGELRLVDEHRDELVVVRQVSQDALDRDDLLETLDALHTGAKNLSHPTGRDPAR